MERVEGIHHVALRCSDLGRCEAFYREALGLPVLRRWPADGGGDRSVWLSAGGGFLALERADPGQAPAGTAEPFEAAPCGWQVVALAIRPADRAAWKARLHALGVNVERESPWSIFLRDPEGNRVALSHWPEEA
jgi:catechol 2,3-dioxygenase-like lactoylglutathione lyase family enzyme